MNNSDNEEFEIKPKSTASTTTSLLSILDSEEEVIETAAEEVIVLGEEVVIPVESMLPTGRQHISYSELHDWIECPWRHKLKYINKIQMDSESIHTLYGQLIHAGIESYVSDVNKNPIDADKFVAQWHNELIPAFIAKMTIAGNQKAIDDYNKSKDEFDSSIKPVLETLPIWLDKTFPGWTIYGAEFKLYENVGTREDRFFKGFIDCIIKVPKKKKTDEFEYFLLDWKSTSWGWSFEKKTDFNKQLQLVLYKHFFSKKNSIPMKEIKCGFVILKRKPPKSDSTAICELVMVSVGPKTEDRAITLVNNMLAHLNKKLYPKNRSSCKFCNYKNTAHCP